MTWRWYVSSAVLILGTSVSVKMDWWLHLINMASISVIAWRLHHDDLQAAADRGYRRCLADQADAVRAVIRALSQQTRPPAEPESKEPN